MDTVISKGTHGNHLAGVSVGCTLSNTASYISSGLCTLKEIRVTRKVTAGLKT